MDDYERHHVEVVDTVDGTYMVLVDGVQWGPPDSPRDRAGAAGDEWETPEQAWKAWRDNR